MTDQIHPIARAIFGDGGGEKDREVPCRICGKPTTLPGFIVKSLREWNRHVDRLAVKNQASHDDLMRLTDVDVACDGPCTAEMFQRKHDAEQREHAETIALWNLLRNQDSYTPESLAILRARGYREQVAQYFARRDKPAASERRPYEEGNRRDGRD